MIIFFAVFKEDIRILLISRQSERIDSPCDFSIYSVKINSRNQYSVSAVSLREICSLAMKSAGLTP